MPIATIIVVVLVVVLVTILAIISVGSNHEGTKAGRCQNDWTTHNLGQR